MVDIPNEIASLDQSNISYLSYISRKGLIYFPDFCQLVLERFRESESEEEDFFQSMFKVGEGGGVDDDNDDISDDVRDRALSYRLQG